MSRADADALPASRLHFGALALLKELITRDQLDHALRAQADRRDRRSRAPKIATLLVREGLISKTEAKELLELQRDHGPIDGYQLREHLGSGGMGCVFKALDESSGREVALKILPPSATQNDRYRARFLRESKTLGQLSHPNLVRCYDQGECDEHLFFAMELVPGVTLRERIRREGAMPEAGVRSLARQLLLAMAHYWEQRVVHRDIKPENILWTPDGVAKLTDLGLCRQLDDDAHLTRVGKTLGTPLYISPELARGRSDVDIRSDLYSLGATLYHVACGVPPFEAAAPADLLRQHVERAPPAPRLKNPRLSDGLEQLLLALLEKDRDARPASPEAALEALDRLEQGKPPFERRRRPGSGSGAAGAPARRRGSTSAVRAVPTGSAVTRGAGWAPPRPRRARAQSAATVAAFALLFGLGVVIGAVARTPAAAETPRVVDETALFLELVERSPLDAVAAARRYAAERPDDLPGQVFRLSALAERLPEGAPALADVKLALSGARERLEERAFEDLEQLRTAVIEAVDAGRPDEARRRLDAFPAFYRVTAAWEGWQELDRALR